MVSNDTSKNLIGLPKAYESIANTYPNDYKYYLDDGKKGLDVSTALFNINLANGTMTFKNIALSESSIGDGIPDIIVTQTGNPDGEGNSDVYSFRNKNGAVVGVPYSVYFSGTVSRVAENQYVFYTYDYALADNSNAKINISKKHDASNNNAGKRDLRMLAFDWSDLGISKDNYKDVYSFNQVFKGSSDIAFIAFNESSLMFVRNISGNVKQVELDGITKSPFEAQYITMDLHLVKNGVMESVPKKSVDIDNNGNYTFKNVESNIPTEFYRIVANVKNSIAPKSFFIVENIDNTLNNYVDFNLGYDNVINRNFVLANFCIKTLKYQKL